MAGVHQAPHGVWADPQQLRRLPNPQVVGHRLHNSKCRGFGTMKLVRGSYLLYLLDICEFQSSRTRSVVAAAYSHAMAEIEVRPIGRQELEEVLPLIAGYQQFYGAPPAEW